MTKKPQMSKVADVRQSKTQAGQTPINYQKSHFAFWRPANIVREGDGTMSRQSKFLSLILRHKPEVVGLTLDKAGWVQTDELLQALKKAGRPMSQQELEALVAGNDKKRFTISGDGECIRAAQGHSIQVELGLSPRVPPDDLFHGTARQNLDGIFTDGLKPMGRRHVHLSESPSDAAKVGQRHGIPVVLQVPALRMHEEGHVFLVADNGVWLVDIVPARYLGFWTR